jgi:hypothetical protein
MPANGCGFNQSQFDPEDKRMKAAAMLIGLLASLSAASEETTDAPQKPSVEILGVKIERGMSESQVRASLPNIHCTEKAPDVAPGFDHCSVSDDVPPGEDGTVKFKDGIVYSASRNWFIPEGAEPIEVLMMLNDILTRLTGEEEAACAKIETHIDQYSTVTMFALPEKVLTVWMHTMQGRETALFTESLRVNPVPDSYKTSGKKMQGTEWCAYTDSKVD